MTHSVLPVAPSVDVIEKTFADLKARIPRQRALSAKERIARLDALYREVWKRRNDLKTAMWNDFRKPAEEVDLTEIFVIKSEIKTVKRNLHRWMRPKRMPGGLAQIGSASWVRPEAKGVVLIISPWNYPMQLVFRPLIAALAAGCTAMIKPSELTGHTAQVVAEIVSAAFESDEVAVVQGGVDTATHMLNLPFNHIYFTGSPAVGKIVMKAASQHPCSVTLELGGKSPVILDDMRSFRDAAKKVAWAKLSNAGQICVAPDYVFVPANREAEFISAVKRAMLDMYPGETSANKDYQRIVAPHHAKRISKLVDDAIARGAKCVLGGDIKTDSCFVPPIVLTGIDKNAKILEEEIFGPVLPIIPYTSLDEVIRFVNDRPTPLALYVFSKRKRFVDSILSNIQSGGASINNCVIHVSSNYLPFGGLGNSGIGSGHGEYGYLEFTHLRGVYEQRFDGAGALLMPPYSSWKTNVIDRLLRWL
ncbi:MAG TPA: aldehyde dehydrogenase family protein [Flavobacteriales bacterium]|nr:aldehyde dehydrogenase family protein [Flavobacteriales bacterium]